MQNQMGIHYREATREELAIAFSWAAEEGWNPGIDDLDVFWETDPHGYVVAEKDGEVVATGSIVSYGAFGFMGFFIVRQNLRGRGIGREFWLWRKERLQGRLPEGATVGMDGVFNMQPFYSKGGFGFSHRNLRMEGVGKTLAPDRDTDVVVVPVDEVPFEQILALDTRCFGFERRRFLRLWLASEHGWAVGALSGNELVGYGVIRECETGFKIGPLFSKTPIAAEAIFRVLSTHATGKPIFLDIPENNRDAMALAGRHGMREMFGCARMYAGPAPPLPWEHIYGVTTFELG